MSLAILADIHGNVSALEAVLADAAGQRVERVIVNGDMVNRGPGGVAVMRRLADAGLPCTLGNHDDLMRKWVDRDDDLPPSWFHDPFWRATGWCAERLDEEGWVDVLRELPLTLEVPDEDAGAVLVSHGSPRDYREGYGRYLDERALDAIVDEHPARVFVGSHTHRPLVRRWSGRTFLNTGSVGTPFNGDPRAQYLILRVEDGRWRPEFRAVPYDRDAALAAFHDSGFLAEGGLSARIFYAELLHARSYLTPFQLWAERRGTTCDEASWQRYREEFAERFEDPGASGGADLRAAGVTRAPGT